MSTPILPNAPKSAHSPAPWRLENGNCGAMIGVMSAQNKPVAMMGRALAINPADANLIIAAPELLRENKSASASLDTIIRQLEVADSKICESDDIPVDLMQLADELRLIRNCLENAARDAQGDASCP